MSSPDLTLPTAVSPDALRVVMRSVPSPVTVVTATTGDEVRGMTIGSFTSVSLEPPLISFNVQRIARMSAVLEGASHFSVHILGVDQASLSNHFAIPDVDGIAQFANVLHRVDEHGVPILDDALARLDCVPFAIHPAGDHILMLGEVTHVVEPTEGEKPLLYFDRAYRKIGSSLG
ncbi:MAG: flavin reductase family protein [Rhodothermales bacterium]